MKKPAYKLITVTVVDNDGLALSSCFVPSQLRKKVSKKCPFKLQSESPVKWFKGILSDMDFISSL